MHYVTFLRLLEYTRTCITVQSMNNCQTASTAWLKSGTCFTTKTMDVSGWPFCRPAEPRSFWQNRTNLTSSHTWQGRKKQHETTWNHHKQPLPHVSSCYLRLFPVLASSKHFASRFRASFLAIWQALFTTSTWGGLACASQVRTGSDRFGQVRTGSDCKTLGNFGHGVDAKRWRNREPPLLQCSGCPRHVMVFCLCSKRDQTFL